MFKFRVVSGSRQAASHTHDADFCGKIGVLQTAHLIVLSFVIHQTIAPNCLFMRDKRHQNSREVEIQNSQINRLQQATSTTFSIYYRIIYSKSYFMNGLTYQFKKYWCDVLNSIHFFNLALSNTRRTCMLRLCLVDLEIRGALRLLEPDQLLVFCDIETLTLHSYGYQPSGLRINSWLWTDSR